MDKFSSAWASQFKPLTIRPLIVCRGPIRQETIDVFRDLSIKHFGILLSEKDAWLFSGALAPEVKWLLPHQVHRVKDYTGVNRDERLLIIQEIIKIARQHDYNAIFAGYGFMAEEAEFVENIEKAGLIFIGPSSRVVKKAGNKDEAKAIAIENKVKVVPGDHQLTIKALLRKYPTLSDLKECAQLLGGIGGGGIDERYFDLPAFDAHVSAFFLIAEKLLELSYKKHVELITIQDIACEAKVSIRILWDQYPEYRLRFKAISGGGGKGQRLLASPFTGYDYEKISVQMKNQLIDQALTSVENLIFEVLQEVKALSAADNKNIVLELNIENIRHLEVQLIGNGKWVKALGLRDCSFQINEQKLIEVSLTQEEIENQIKRYEKNHELEQLSFFNYEKKNIIELEQEAEAFAQAVGLNSVSTFECIVDEQHHFFMEMNTRIQVEHRVTERVYALQFINPEDGQDFFIVDSLVELMVLLALFSEKLPKPIRVPKTGSVIEVRLNAMNEALQPHAGGKIESWSQPLSDEIRDDQAISMPLFSTGKMQSYVLAGMYDSNIALILSGGAERFSSVSRMREILKSMQISGSFLKTNLNFLRGVLSWWESVGFYCAISTRFVFGYLEAVAYLKTAFDLFCCDTAWAAIKNKGMINPQVLAVLKKEEISAYFDNLFSLVLRPLKMLLNDIHLFSSFIWPLEGMMNEKNMLKVSPFVAIKTCYECLNMFSSSENKPALYEIWPEDKSIILEAEKFYSELSIIFGEKEYSQWHDFFNCSYDQLISLYPFLSSGCDEASFLELKKQHYFFNMPSLLFEAIFLIAKEAGVYRIKPKFMNDLAFLPKNSLSLSQIKSKLIPFNSIIDNKILAETGGMFYAQEAPHLPPFVKEGDVIEQGQPLYVIEVMKMFNKVLAPFSGVVKKILYGKGQGEIVKVGQPLFIVEPQEKMELLGDFGNKERLANEWTT